MTLCDVVPVMLVGRTSTLGGSTDASAADAIEGIRAV